MFWKPRTNSIIISAELHQKIAQTCKPVYQADSEVVRVRPVAKTRSVKKKVKAQHEPMVCYGA